jgi:hypothetical protein
MIIEINKFVNIYRPPWAWLSQGLKTLADDEKHPLVVKTLPPWELKGG